MMTYERIEFLDQQQLVVMNEFQRSMEVYELQVLAISREGGPSGTGSTNRAVVPSLHLSFIKWYVNLSQMPLVSSRIGFERLYSCTFDIVSKISMPGFR